MTNSPKAQIDDSHGFIRAHCQSCGGDDVWLRCNTCAESDHFVREEERVVCRCGATYAFATCTCGEPVPMQHLEWVHFKKGPASLAKWEWDPKRIALLGLLVVIAIVMALVVAL